MFTKTHDEISQSPLNFVDPPLLSHVDISMDSTLSNPPTSSMKRVLSHSTHEYGLIHAHRTMSIIMTIYFEDTLSQLVADECHSEHS